MKASALARTALAACLAALAWSACVGDPYEAAKAGEGDPSTAGIGTLGAGSCDGIADGICDFGAGEDCHCIDCLATARCEYETDPDFVFCNGKGGCGPEDPCICLECADDPFCADPGKANCTDDGVCNWSVEGCRCADCVSRPECQESCAGAAADGACVDEPCSCPDCFDRCVVACVDDGVCFDPEPCWCADCVADQACATHCELDGVCSYLLEGCSCIDCADRPECQPGFTGAGGAGGAGGGGGAGGAAAGGAGGAGGAG